MTDVLRITHAGTSFDETWDADEILSVDEIPRNEPDVRTSQAGEVTLYDTADDALRRFRVVFFGDNANTLSRLRSAYDIGEAFFLYPFYNDAIPTKYKAEFADPKQVTERFAAGLKRARVPILVEFITKPYVVLLSGRWRVTVAP